MTPLFITVSLTDLVPSQISKTNYRKVFFRPFNITETEKLVNKLKAMQTFIQPLIALNNFSFTHINDIVLTRVLIHLI